MTPQQVDALEELLFFLFGILSIPVSWFYAHRRGRRPWLWAMLAAFIAWIAALLLMLLPDKSKPKLPSGIPAQNPDGDNDDMRKRIEEIQAERNLRDFLRGKR